MRRASYRDSKATSRPERDAARNQTGRGRRQPHVLNLDTLEERTLMSILPPIVTTSPTSPVTGYAGNQNTPSIAVDPTNPRILVSVWTLNDPIDFPLQKVVSQGAYSTNGGQSWSSFNPLQSLPDPSVTTNPPPLPVLNSTVAFDRSGDFYVVGSESNSGNTGGYLVLSKYTVNAGGGLNSDFNTHVLASWSANTQVAFLDPTIAVDNNLNSSFAGVQSDPLSGNVYIATTSIVPNPNNLPNFNPNVVFFNQSTDGGNTFSGFQQLDGNFGLQRDSAPRITVSQGNPGGTVTPGAVTVLWDDYGSGATATPYPYDLIKTVTIQPDQLATGANQLSAPIAPGASTLIPINVTGSASSITGLNLGLNLLSVLNSDLTVTLTNPAGTTTVTLISNGKVAGSNLGVAVGGTLYDTVFTSTAATSIDAATGPAIGQYAPEQSFGAFNGQNPAGVWMLSITNGSAANTADFLSARLTALGGNSTTSGQNVAALTYVRGTFTGLGNPTTSLATPIGIGPDATMASDNSLSTNSPYSGRIYMTYVNKNPFAIAAGLEPADDTNIYMIYSDNGGASWSAPSIVNNDNANQNGYSQSYVDANGTYLGNRPRFDPSVAVDPASGAVVVSYYDTSYDAARARAAMSIQVSIDGGQTFNESNFANQPLVAFNQASQQNVTLGPIPDNQSGGNSKTDGTYGFGTSQSLAVLDGHIYPAWSGNDNGGSDNTNIELLNIHVGSELYSVGPRVIAATEGPVGTSGDTLNPSNASGAQAQAFQVTFDRPVSIASLNTSDFTVQARDASGNLLPTQPAILGFTVLQQNAFGATQVQVDFTPDATPGTVSYAVSSAIQTAIPVPRSNGTYASGSGLDQNPGGVGAFAAPTPVNGNPFQAPFVQNSQPLVIPGPHVISTSIPGGTGTDNLMLNGTVSELDVTFDRPMNPASFTAAQVLRIMGPYGLVPGPYTVTPDAVNPALFHIGFPTQQLNGTYTITLASSITSVSGFQVDNNLNAGLTALLGTAPSGTTTVTTTNNTPVQIAPGTSPTPVSTITLSDNFLIQGITLGLNISTNPGDDPLLKAYLVAPGVSTTINPASLLPGQIALFSNLSANGTGQNFTNTVFDDSASTPIQNGGAPYFGRFAPQEPLNVLNGTSSVGGPGGAGTGVYTLEIMNGTTSDTVTLTNWSLNLQKPVVSTGLGEPVADQTEASFRIFTMSPTNSLSSSTWTSVGPAAANSSGNSGRVTGLVVDPSDPSGNTVYIGGASGGVWKTTDFLTTNPNGPTWIPLTDFGPNNSIFIGSIAIFPRNNDPNQSIVIAATGEGDTGTPGVGFLLSKDGGATWTLLDSTNNNLPFSQRDHIFAQGTTSFKVVVDPNLTSSGQVIIYAALSGAQGGIWRSFDTGQTWTKVLAGNATDVTLAPTSGVVDAVSNPTGNLQIVYAAIAGVGVYISPNEGTVWNLMAGGVGDPLTQNADAHPSVPVPVANDGISPNGGFGRIALAVPALVPSSQPNSNIQNIEYSGWLYAAVVNTAGSFQGLYLTKDYGHNWTLLTLPAGPIPGAQPGQAGVPSNNTALPNISVPGSPNFPQGNYDLSLGIDPLNPNITYLGGTHDGNPTGLIRVDATAVADPYAFYLSNSANDGGTLQTASKTGISFNNPNDQNPYLTKYVNPYADPTLNLLRSPSGPYADSTFYTNLAGTFSNDGTGVKWIPFDIGGTDQHRMFVMVDPATGLPRIIVADDQGVYTGLDNNGTLINSNVSTGPANPESGAGIGVPNPSGILSPTGSRNGNLQITQFYYSASQPSSLASQIAGALFYGQAQDNGSLASDPNILTNGNLNWSGPGGDGAGVATDQTGSGTAYFYNWPCCGGDTTNFFQSSTGLPGNGVGRTNGLLQSSGNGLVPDPQWPFLGGANFAVNPIDGNGSTGQIVISAPGTDVNGQSGRIFRTENAGTTWLVIGNPTALDNSYAPALAFGAPDPALGSSVDNFIYAGTVKGDVFVTFTGGGSNGNNWINITNGALAGNTAPFQQIVADPTRGMHDAYAVTSNGVYYIADSNPNDGGSAASHQWVNITGNLFSLTRTAFQGTAFNDPTMVFSAMQSLSSIAVDWRYVIPNDFANPAAGSHPMLYVGGMGGVVRSTDQGATWTVFPSLVPNSLNDTVTPPGNGGLLPNVGITSLSPVLGNIDPTTGRPNVATGPNVLLASTYGRGDFAIRLAPDVFPQSLELDPNNPAPGGSVDLPPTNGVPTTAFKNAYIAGVSEQSAFGNTVYITLYDMSNPASPVYIGGYNPADPTTMVPANETNGFGNFSVKITADLALGTKNIGVMATDASGTQGNIALFTYILAQTPTPTSLTLQPTSDSGISNTDNYTNVTAPFFNVGGVLPNSTVLLFQGGVVVNTVNTSAGGVVAIQAPGPLRPDGVYSFTAEQSVDYGTASANTSLPTGADAITIDTATPVAPNQAVLDANSRPPGSLPDHTNNPRPTFDVSGLANNVAQLELFRGGTLINTVTIQSSAPPNFTAGTYKISDPNTEPNGTYVYTTEQIDLAGNVSAMSPGFTVYINTTPPVSPLSVALDPGSDTGLPNHPNVTSDNRPFFDVNGVNPNSLVNLYQGGVLVNSVATVTGGTVLIQDPGPISPDGIYLFTATQADQYGNVSPATASTGVTILTTPPSPPTAIKLLPVSDTGRFNNDGVTNITSGLLFAVSGAIPASEVVLVRNGIAVDAVSTVSGGTVDIADYGPGAAGNYSYSAYLIGPSGVSGSTGPVIPVQIITTPPPAPNAPLLQPSSDTGSSNTDGITNAPSVLFSVTGVAATSQVLLLRDGVAVDARIGPGPIADYGPIPAGTHVFTAEAIDLAGNVSTPSAPTSVTFIYSAPTMSAPVLQPGSDSGISQSDNITNVATPVFNANGAEAGAKVVLTRDGVPVDARVGNGPIQDYGPISQGNHVYQLYQVDVAGNTSTFSAPTTVEFIFTPPSPPTTFAVNPTSITGTPGTGNLTANPHPVFDVTGVDGAHYVALFRDNTLVNFQNGSSPIGDPGSPLTNPLTPVANGTHAYQVATVDLAGNISALSAPILVTVDTVHPVVSGFQTTVNSNGILTGITLHFSKQLYQPSVIVDPSNIVFGAFHLISAGADGIFGTPDDRLLTLVNGAYNASTNTVHFVPSSPISVRTQALQIFVNSQDGIIDLAGNPLAQDFHGYFGLPPKAGAGTAIGAAAFDSVASHAADISGTHAGAVRVAVLGHEAGIVRKKRHH